MYIIIGKCFGFIALISSLVGLLPQVYKSYVTKITRDISMLMLVNFVICSSSWLIYGICQGLTFVILSNVAGLAPEQTKSVKPERNVLMHIAVIFGYNFMKKCFCSYNRVRNGAINVRGSV